MIIVLCLCILLCPVLISATPDEEFVGPLVGWIDVTQAPYSAPRGVGTDATAEIQAALTAMGQEAIPNRVLYFPAGDYYISTALFLAPGGTTPLNVALVGEDPATTRLLWDGANDSDMLDIDRGYYTRIARLTFDAAGHTGIKGITFWGSVAGYANGMEVADVVLADLARGLWCGGSSYSETACAEITILRTTFQCAAGGIGVQIGAQNALDVWIWESHFVGCGRAVTNVGGAGSFHVYRSLFEGSTVADMSLNDTEGFAARGNVSIGSTTFFQTTYNPTNAAPTTIQGNRVLDPVDDMAIVWGNEGPLLLLDNLFRKTVVATAVVGSNGETEDVIAVGNRFSTDAGHDFSVGGRFVEYGTLHGQTIADSPLVLPPTPPKTARNVAEVTTANTTAEIQTAINTQHARHAKAVVHFQLGTYNLTETLHIPAGSDIQLIGDGYRSELRWAGVAGGGPVLYVHGPTKARLSELAIHGGGTLAQANPGTVTGLYADNLDQAGARIAMQGVMVASNVRHNLRVEGLDHAVVDLRDMQHQTTAIPSTEASVSVIGGPQGTSQVHWWSGASSAAPVIYSLEDAYLLLRDIWYENTADALVQLSGSGSFTWETSKAQTNAGLLPNKLLLDVGAFDGTVSLLTSWVDANIQITGNQAKVVGLGLSGPPVASVPDYFDDSSTPPADARLLSSRVRSGSTSAQRANETGLGTDEATFLTTMLAQTRGAMPALIEPLPAGVTDLRLRRVLVKEGLQGIHLYAAPPPRQKHKGSPGFFR